jgi:hypothetical protein
VKRKLTPAFIDKPPLPEPGRERTTYWDGSSGLGLTVTARATSHSSSSIAPTECHVA